MGNIVYGYLSARVHESVCDYNKSVCSQLRHPIQMLLPQEYYAPQESPDPEAIVNRCIDDIIRSKFVLLLPEFGRDCAWEVGFSKHRKLPVVAYIDTQTLWLTNRGDVMSPDELYAPRSVAPIVSNEDSTCAMHSVEKIATTNRQTYEMLMNHNVVAKKLVLLGEVRELNALIHSVI